MRRSATVKASRVFLMSVLVAAIGGCTLGVPPFNPAISTATASIETEAAAFFSELGSKTAPACAFEANAATYQSLSGRTASLAQQVAPGDSAMKTAVDGLTQVVTGAERAHRLASATITDPAGACLAPEVLTLNAEAVARATAAIRELQRARQGG
jgi:hypothetical protein